MASSYSHGAFECEHKPKILICLWGHLGKELHLNKDWAAVAQGNISGLQCNVVHSPRIATIHSNGRDAI